MSFLLSMMASDGLHLRHRLLLGRCGTEVSVPDAQTLSAGQAGGAPDVVRDRTAVALHHRHGVPRKPAVAAVVVRAAEAAPAGAPARERAGHRARLMVPAPAALHRALRERAGCARGGAGLAAAQACVPGACTLAHAQCSCRSRASMRALPASNWHDVCDLRQQPCVGGGERRCTPAMCALRAQRRQL